MNAYRDQYATLFKNGRGVVLIAISADPDTALASWARDSEFPFLFASDSATAVARQYGALADEPGTDQSQPVRRRAERAGSPTGRFRSGKWISRPTRYRGGGPRVGSKDRSTLSEAGSGKEFRLATPSIKGS